MIIQGSDINVAALHDVESLADLKELKIFSHLPNEDEANEELWETLKGSTSKIPLPEPDEDKPDYVND